MIVSDFDGTLFGREDDRLRSDFITKIKKLTDCGVFFVVNSGRPYGSLKEFLKEACNRTVFICNDGAQIMYKNCLIYKMPIEKSAVLKLADLTMGNELSTFVSLRDKNLPVDMETINQKGGLNEEVYKVVIIKDKNDPALFERVKSLAESLKLRVCYEDKTYLEFCRADVNKGKATAYLKKRFGITNGVVAFGDGSNDLPLFDQADTVYIMNSAKEISYPGAKVIDDMQSFVVENL